MVKDINPVIRVAEDSLCDSFPHSFKEFNNYLYFVADDGIGGEELWKTNGTYSGTVLVKNINASDSSSPKFLTAGSSRLFFYANDGINGLELWSTTGTAESTQMIKNINLPEQISSSQPVIVGSYCYFTADDGNGLEIWRTDGTVENTSLIIDGTSSNPRNLISAFGSLYFTADTSSGTYLFSFN